MIDIIKQKIEKIKDIAQDEQMRIYFIGGVMLASGLIYLTVIIIPQFTILAKLSRQVNDLSSNIEITGNRIAKIDEMDSKIADIKQKLDSMAKQLPGEKGITGLLEWFSSVAQISGVRILSITPEGLKEAKGRSGSGKYYSEMPVKITAKSGFHQLGSFISNLEKGKRIIFIDNIQIAYDGNSPRAHNVNLLVKTYVSLGENKKR